MSHFTVDTDAWFRTAGYPLLITATLYPWTFSMIGVLAVQALFAALIPWLIYRILLLRAVDTIRGLWRAIEDPHAASLSIPEPTLFRSSRDVSRYFVLLPFNQISVFPEY